MHYDVFNGDADGLCALVQLRLAQPMQSTLVTGVKRQIQLLSSLSVETNDSVTVLDISLKKNRWALDEILAKGASVFYVDHHEVGDMPIHPNLKTLIDTSPTMCTSLLVDDYLQGQYRAWAITAAFGDNLNGIAEQKAQALGLSMLQTELLKTLGICLNYNAYGSQVSDLHVAPDALYEHLKYYPSPFDFITDQTAMFEQLRSGYTEDMQLGLSITPDYKTDKVALIRLPDAPWARRINGVLGNELANQYPHRAHAIVTLNSLGSYQVSVRAPLENKTGADELCALFKTGGGRKSAAGINDLAIDQLGPFVKAFEAQYG